MPQQVASVGTFLIYFRHLSAALKKNLDFDVLSDANFANILSEKLFSIYLSSFFVDRRKTISDVALNLYDAYYEAKRKISHINALKNDEELTYLSLIVMMLKIIKYSCTIINEYGKVESAFYKKNNINIIRNDFIFNVRDWNFITDDQLRMRIISSFMIEGISPICPATDFRPENLFLYYDRFERKPLLIVNEASFKASVDNMITKFSLEDSKNKPCRHSKATYKCLYSGSFAQQYEAPFVKEFERIYKEFESLRSENIETFGNYEVIFAIEITPSKAYSVIIDYKFYLFEKVQHIGYVLQAYIRSGMKNSIEYNFFCTKMVKKEIILAYLNTINAYFNSALTIDKIKDTVSSDSSRYEGIEKKEYRLSSIVLDEFQKDNYTTQVPSFILCP